MTQHISPTEQAILIGQGGNNTVAALSYLHEHKLAAQVKLISVLTGFADERWLKHLQEVHDFASSLGFSTEQLCAKPFTDWLRAKRNFPSRKFPWCAGALKGITLNDYLDEVDALCQLIILLPKRALDSRSNHHLQEWITHSEHFGGRRVWHPLLHVNDEDMQELIQKTSFPILNHRALECDPCVYNSQADFARLTTETIMRVEVLERELAQTMFDQPIDQYKGPAEIVTMPIVLKHALNQFDMSCGAPYGCGL